MPSKTLLSALLLPALLAVGARAQESDGLPTDLQEVVITATKMNLPLKNIPQKVEVIDRSKIESIPAETLAELLKKVSPIDVIQYPGTSATIGIRGFAPSAHNRNYSIVLIDGKPAGTTNLLSIPTAFVESIEIVKGPYSVLYGSDAMGGVINIITRRPGEEEYAYEGSLGFGSFGRTLVTSYASGTLGQHLRLALGVSSDRRTKDYKIGARHLLPMSETEKLILDKKSFGDVMDHTKTSLDQYTAMLDFDLPRHWSGAVTASYVESEGIEMPGNYWHSYGMTTEDFYRLNLSLDLKRVTRHNVLTFSPYFTDYREQNYPGKANDVDNFISDKNRMKQYGFKLYDTQRWGAFKLLSGIDLDGSLVSSQRFASKGTPDNPFRPDYDALSASAYLQGAYTLDFLSANVGVRYTYSHLAVKADPMLGNEAQSRSYSNLSPALGVKYFILPSLNIHGSLGTAFYLPDAYQTAGQFTAGGYSYKGNPDLKTETSFSFDLGVNYNIGRLLNADVTYFRTLYQNKITTDYSNPQYTTYMNADKGHISGLEVMLSADFAPLFAPRQSLELYASYTRLFEDVFEAGTGKSKVNKSVLGVRRNTGNFGINYDDGRRFATRLNARLMGHVLENDWMTYPTNLRPEIGAEDYYAGEGYTSADMVLRHPMHLVFDFSAQYKVFRDFKVSVEVSNLFDENYTEKDGYHMPGRSIMGKMTYSF